MMTLPGTRVPPSSLEEHQHICDFINVEAPVLSLYSDGKRNWLYLWCDTDTYNTHRWLIFLVERSDLVEYLEFKKPLLTLIEGTSRMLILESETIYEFIDGEPKVKKSSRKLRRIQHIKDVKDYLPSADSYFDADLTSDIELSEQITPAAYEIPIAGTWFGADFENLFQTYERLYAFCYATKPRFIKTAQDRLRSVLRAPWKGGFSRLHMYSQLAHNIPGLHALRVTKFVFNSPGQVEFEAIASIGDTIRISTLQLLENEVQIDAAVKAIRTVLSVARLNKEDLSNYKDKEIAMAQSEIDLLESNCTYLANVLQLSDEFTSLKLHAPNTVVYAKAAISFVKQLKKLGTLQQDKMLTY